jgi:beta-phosphoglucomutase-like phosphatase (HAD superfamily)
LVFEDTHAGVIAARRAGMDVIAVYDVLSEPYHEVMKKDVLEIIADYEGLLDK